MDSHFCIGHVVDMRLIYLSIYIFDAHGGAFMDLLCESFYDALECLCDVLLHSVCIF